jgi:hypothetical protein
VRRGSGKLESYYNKEERLIAASLLPRRGMRENVFVGMKALTASVGDLQTD